MSDKGRVRISLLRTELAERIERSETELITAGAAVARRRNRAAAFVIPVAGACFAEDGSPLKQSGVVTSAPGSQQNVQRQGFALLYTHAVLVEDTE